MDDSYPLPRDCHIMGKGRVVLVQKSTVTVQSSTSCIVFVTSVETFKDSTIDLTSIFKCDDDVVFKALRESRETFLATYVKKVSDCIMSKGYVANLGQNYGYVRYGPNKKDCFFTAVAFSEEKVSAYYKKMFDCRRFFRHSDPVTFIAVKNPQQLDSSWLNSRSYGLPYCLYIDLNLNENLLNKKYGQQNEDDQVFEITGIVVEFLATGKDVWNFRVWFKNLGFATFDSQRLRNTLKDARIVLRVGDRLTCQYRREKVSVKKHIEKVQMRNMNEPVLGCYSCFKLIDYDSQRRLSSWIHSSTSITDQLISSSSSIDVVVATDQSSEISQKSSSNFNNNDDEIKNTTTINIDENSQRSNASTNVDKLKLDLLANIPTTSTFPVDHPYLAIPLPKNSKSNDVKGLNHVNSSIVDTNGDTRHDLIDQSIKSADQSIKSADLSIKSADLSIKSADQSIKSADQSIKSADQSIKSADISIKSTDDIIKLRGVGIGRGSRSVIDTLHRAYQSGRCLTPLIGQQIQTQQHLTCSRSKGRALSYYDSESNDRRSINDNDDNMSIDRSESPIIVDGLIANNRRNVECQTDEMRLEIFLKKLMENCKIFDFVAETDLALIREWSALQTRF